MTLSYEGPPINGYSVSERSTQQQQPSHPLDSGLTNGPIHVLIDKLAKGMTDDEVQHLTNAATNGATNGSNDSLSNELAKVITDNDLAKDLFIGTLNGFADEVGEVAKGITDATDGVVNGVTAGTRAPHPSISSSNGLNDDETTPGSSVSSVSAVLSYQNKLAYHVQGCEIGHCVEGCRSILQLQAELEDKRLPQWLDSMAGANAAAVQV